MSNRLEAVIYERTEGHALFLVNIVEHLVAQGVIAHRNGYWTLHEGDETRVASLPEGVRQLLVRRLEDLAPEARRVLEAASVVGEHFTVAAVAAGAQSSIEEVEAWCEALAAQYRFLVDVGLREWPGGTSSGRYRFAHALYRQVLYEGLGTVRRRHLHRRIGLRLEAGYGTQAGEIASQLAVHFERGGEIARAVDYWQQVGRTAARRNRDAEAIAALKQGLALLATLPESPEQTRQELALQLALADLLRATQGLGAPDVGDVYTRAYTLCQQTGEACFQQAIVVARSQQARAFELRAGLCLGRLWQSQGRRHAARALLAPIYDWFTEGFDTADLQEAEALLKALS